MKLYRFGNRAYDMDGGISLFEQFMIDYLIASGSFIRGSVITDTQYAEYVFQCLTSKRYLDWNRAQMRINARFTRDLNILRLFGDLLCLSDNKLMLFLSWCLGHCLLERVPKQLQSQIENRLRMHCPNGYIYRFVRQNHIPIWALD